MHCDKCHSAMSKTQQDAGVRSIQTWFECPLCGRKSLFSEPVRPHGHSRVPKLSDVGRLHSTGHG